MMQRKSRVWLATLVLCSYSFADEPSVTTSYPMHLPIQTPSATTPPTQSHTEQQHIAKPVREKTFKPFTGKVTGKKVRMRVQPDLESHVIKELNRGELISVVEENHDFYAVVPGSDVKAYVFRSLILDNVVEGNRVNVRLAPDLEAPIIGHLNAGDRVDPVVSSVNNKWYEIDAPSETRFYIAKEYVENVGGPELKSQIDKRKAAAEQLLDAAMLLSKAELKKSYDEINIERIKRSFATIMTDYTDFPEFVERAKEAYTAANESYLQKKIAFLEEKTLPIAASDEIKEQEILEEEVREEIITAKADPTERMRMWQPVEEALFLTWQRMNEELTLNDFYEDQQLTAAVLTGILEPYISPVKNKPGDFILRDKDLPVAYLYSTTCNLHDFVGKKITVQVSPRENNHFAFPAYYVHRVE